MTVDAEYYLIIKKIFNPGSWIVFAGVYLFLRLYSPMNKYGTKLMIGVLALLLTFIIFEKEPEAFANIELFEYIFTMVFASVVFSLPFQMAGVFGAFIQQNFMLDEQSTQDSRFTDQSTALANMSHCIATLLIVESGVLFLPVKLFIDRSLPLFNAENVLQYLVLMFEVMMIITLKYLIIILPAIILVSVVEFYFKNTNLTAVSVPVKLLILVFLLYAWFYSDVEYIVSFSVDFILRNLTL